VRSATEARLSPWTNPQIKAIVPSGQKAVFYRALLRNANRLGLPQVGLFASHPSRHPRAQDGAPSVVPVSRKFRKEGWAGRPKDLELYLLKSLDFFDKRNIFLPYLFTSKKHLSGTHQMSQWDDRIRVHQVWSELESLGPVIDQVLASENPDPELLPAVTRIRAVLAYAPKEL
jgi:hypothetical protein